MCRKPSFCTPASSSLTMPQNSVTFRIKLAGIPAEIRCRQEETRTFLHDWLTEERPEFICEVTDDSIDMVSRNLNAEDRKYGVVREYSLRWLENNAVHAILAEKLVDYGVLLMHGSAICVDERAYIFTAKSGTGKSTHAGFWRELFKERAFMINDDKPLLKAGDNGIMVYGTPWNGKHGLGRNACAPLEAIAYLKRAQENRAERMSAAEAYPVLVQQSYSSRDTETMRKILDIQKRIIQSVPFYRLWCNMEPEAAYTAWSAMNSAKNASE